MSMTPPPPPLTPSGATGAPRSATEALMPAWGNTKRVLFEPFSARKWLKLGLIAMLAGVMGGGGGGGGGPSGGGGGGGGAPFEGAWQQLVGWYEAHTAVILLAAVVLGLLVLVVSFVLVYVSSVFRFIFLGSVITNETRIRESWRRNRVQGFSYFLWRLGFGLVALVVVGLVVGLPVGLMVMALVKHAGGQPSIHLILGSVGLILVAVLLLILCAIVLGLIGALTRDFVLPLMYQRRIGVLAAWREFRPILGANKVGFVVYFLLKLVAAFAAGLVGMLGALVALLVAMIPLGILGGIGYVVVRGAGIDSWSWSYLWGIVPVGFAVLMGLVYWVTCVLLPIPVFFQSYALKYLGYVEPTAVTI